MTYLEEDQKRTNIIRPNAYFEERGIGTRSANAAGTDLLLNSEGDFAVSADGDLTTVTSSTNIVEAFLRRLMTPEFGFKRWIRTMDGVEATTEDYGNKAYNYLSAPIAVSSTESLKKVVVEAAEADSRLRVLNVSVQAVGFGRINIQLTYVIKGEEQLQTLNYVYVIDTSTLGII